jgi:acyl carrier protein
MPNVLQMKRALVTILGLDWLDRLELMILIEDAFAEVEISENDVTQIDVVGDLMRILTS